MAEAARPGVPVIVPTFYFNGFELGLSNADVIANLTLANGQVATVFMSYTTAKSFAVGLTNLVDQLEKVTERKIMTTNDVAEGLAKIAQERVGE